MLTSLFPKDKNFQKQQLRPPPSSALFDAAALPTPSPPTSLPLRAQHRGHLLALAKELLETSDASDVEAVAIFGDSATEGGEVVWERSGEVFFLGGGNALGFV